MKTVDEIMEQAQVFASAWSLVGGRFDKGGMLAEAEEAKAELRQMVEAALKDREGEIVITKNEAGQICMVSRQDEEGRILSILAESEAPPKAQPMSERDIDRLALDADDWIYGELTVFRHGFRAAERHHKIGD